MKIQKYQVKGSSRFPLDMLRFERCCPYKQEDVSLIDPTSNCLFDERIVELIRHVSCKQDIPCPGRWISFGWEVVPGSISYL